MAGRIRRIPFPVRYLLPDQAGVRAGRTLLIDGFVVEPGRRFFWKRGDEIRFRE